MASDLVSFNSLSELKALEVSTNACCNLPLHGTKRMHVFGSSHCMTQMHTYPVSTIQCTNSVMLFAFF